MGIFYGDLPVGGGSGKAEWDNIEGKPFNENGVLNENSLPEHAHDYAPSEHTHDYAASEHTHFKLLFNFVDDDTFHIRTNITNKSCYVLATSSAGDSVKKDIMHVFYVNSGIGNASGKQWNIQAYTDSDCTIKIGDPVSFTMPPKITVSTTDLTDGASALPAGTFYFVYEE